jgi:6-phosphogluconolactonase
VTPELVVVPTDVEAATSAAEVVADRAERAVGDHGRADLALSGGTTPGLMFGSLAARALPWRRVHIWQVDERVAPKDGPDRNLTYIEAAFGDLRGVTVHPMPVDEPDPAEAAVAYAASLPPTFDLIHLGLGADGHTASLVPGDPVLDVTDRDVALTGEYQGRRRMTLTYRGLARAEEILWLVAGAQKREALGKLLAGDGSIPAGRVSAPRSTIVLDRAALPTDVHAR